MLPIKSLNLKVITIVILITHCLTSFGQHDQGSSRLNNLKFAVNQILNETNTPAAGIALVSKDSAIWIAGLGKASIHDSIDADENTLFRIASVSKMFLGLAILKLQEEGKIDLEHKVRDIIPEIEFTNKWENTDPVRVVHLLEHTTGWDDYHLTEQVTSQISLKQGLDFHPHSRTSRWVPGTRMAYSNSGSGVAAYIVEKITGQPYENYISDNFFRPLNMGLTTFFNDERYQKHGATLYDQDLQSIPYRHVIQRPAGAINSSPKEMANFVRMLLNRGRADSIQLVSEKSVLRMETSKSTPGAKAGLQMGYGLANFTTEHNGFIYHGHNGGLPGALSELAYLPEHGVGHAFFINSANPEAYRRISQLVRDFETHALDPDSVQVNSSYSGDIKFPAGYYASINPRIGWGYFMDRLIDIYEFEANERLVLQSGILPGKKTLFYPLSDSTFRGEKSGKVTMVKAVDPLAGDVLYNGTQVLQPIPAVVVFGQLSIVFLWVILMLAGILVWMIAQIRFWISGRAGGLRICRYPALTSILFLSITVFLVFWAPRYNSLLTEPGLLSISLMLASLTCALSSLWSVVVIVQSRKDRIGKITFIHMSVLSALHVLATIYLSWHGVFPIMTWS